MVHRRSWLRRVADALKRRSVVWIYGVRRAGKTVLCQTVPGIEYFDCELPRTRRSMQDIEGFLEGLTGHTIALDEVHRLPDPSGMLKVAADHFPGVRVIATGSSTLGASARFRDTLAGRRTDVWLTPMTSSDLEDFGRRDLTHRFLRGGLPPFFLGDRPPQREFQEWIDSYWARDLQELFRLERRASMQRFLELLLTQSGGLFEATRFVGPCEISRPTVTNYLGVLEATRVVHVIRPYSSRKASEIVAAPKVYGFDTGFVCHQQGWHDLRSEDLGILWEHFVLNEMHAELQAPVVHYWRDKRGHEVDFVLTPRGRPPIAIECKWSVGSFDDRNLQAFRNHHPDGANCVVGHDVKRPYRQSAAGIKIDFLGLDDLLKRLAGAWKI